MIQIVREDFNNDLDQYISKKRSSDKPFQKTIKELKTKFKQREEPEFEPDKNKDTYKFMSSIFRRRIPSEEEVEREVGKMSTKDKKELKAMENEMEDAEEIEEELEEEREGLMSRFLKKLRLTGKKDYVDEEDVIEAEEEQIEEEEVREVLKILHRWLEQLSPEKLQEFRRSPDFERYKEVLKKLKLIREQ